MFEVELGNLDLQDPELNQFSVDGDYQDQLPPGPPPRGDYRFRITKLTNRTNRDGDPILTDGKWPVLCIEEVEIVEGLSQPRRVMLFQNVYTKPRDRYGKPASQLGDLLRAYDQHRVYQGLNGQIEALKEFVETGATFVARGDWLAEDRDHAQAMIAAAGGSDNLSRDEKNDIYDSCRIRGMNNFPQIAGTDARNPHVQGPSGNMLEARLELRRFYPSDRAASIALGEK